MNGDTTRAGCEERMRVIAAMTRGGYDRERIAYRLGIAPDTVSLYRKRIRDGWVPRGSGGHPNSGSKGFHRDPEFGARVAAMYGSGLSMRGVAAVLGVSVKVVWKAVHTHGVPVRRQSAESDGDTCSSRPEEKGGAAK